MPIVRGWGVAVELFVEGMNMSNVDIVKGIYEAFGRQDVPAILERIDESVAWDQQYADTKVPWLRARRGRAGVGEFFQSLSDLQFDRFEVTRVLGDGDTVVALIDLDATVRSTGKKICERGEVHIWKLNNQGRVVHFRHAVDTAQHERALQSS
jgi:uncharacterized protein